MEAIKQSSKRHIIAITLALPLMVIILLLLFPAWDIQVWYVNWHFHLFYFYTMAFASFMALVAGMFVGPAFGPTTQSRTTITRLAFITIAAFSLLNSINTPYIIFSDIGDEPLKWSMRLSLLLGAILFALATVRWKKSWETHSVTYRLVLWLVSGSLYVLYIGLTLGFPDLLVQLNRYDPLINYLLATVTVGLYLWAAQHSWALYRQEGQTIEGRLTIAFLLLAEAQISQALGIWGQLSWLLASLITVAALSVALSAFLRSFYSLRDLQPARYFAVLGSIVIIGLSLVGGELARWLASDVQRRFVVSLTLIQGTVSFLIMYLIVLGLDRLIRERTAALKHEQILRNNLTQLIVHDLKNPLTVMTQGSTLLRLGRLGELTGEQKKLLHRIEQAGSKMLGLIDDLLDVERLESDAMQLQKTPLDLWKTLGDSVADLQILAEANQQILTLRLTTRLPLIKADTNLMRRVIDNIIVNAIKFSPEGGRIEVRARNDEAHLTIMVADSGPGVHPAHREQIFEKFSQMHSYERRGAGLGLTFCKMAVEAHGGTVTVEDSSLGGALFKITLPLEVDMLAGETNGRPEAANLVAPRTPVSPFQISSPR